MEEAFSFMDLTVGVCAVTFIHHKQPVYQLSRLEPWLDSCICTDCVNRGFAGG